MARLAKIDPSTCTALEADDECFYIGEYTSHGGYGASETNQQIFNLKISPTAPANRLYWKNKAIGYWGDQLADRLNLPVLAAGWTMVPAPCSKVKGDPEYDDRMLRVLQRLAAHRPGLDVRQALVSNQNRCSQHEGVRLSPDELFGTISVDAQSLLPPVQGSIVLVDDVFTRGSTFKAAQKHLLAIPGVVQVIGVFLARTVQPTIDLSAIFGAPEDDQ